MRRGAVRDAVDAVLIASEKPMTTTEVIRAVTQRVDQHVAPSSIRSSLSLQATSAQSCIRQITRGIYFWDDGQSRAELSRKTPSFIYGNATLHNCDAFELLAALDDSSIHAIITDPPYGLVEYDEIELSKLRSGKGGVWRKPPSFDGCTRRPLPRFTTLTCSDLERMDRFFLDLGRAFMRVLVPGANVLVASNPLVQHHVANSLAKAGLEPRGVVVRLVQTMRGGDRPKGHEDIYSEVSVMPRSQWEPWICMRKPPEGTIASNLEKWGCGGWRRPSDDKPFGDVITSSPTGKKERSIANHPSLKPQAFLREIVKASLPLGNGIVLDPFAGSGSTLAAAQNVGYASLGSERDESYYELAQTAIPKLATL